MEAEAFVAEPPRFTGTVTLRVEPRYVEASGFPPDLKVWPTIGFNQELAFRPAKFFFSPKFKRKRSDGERVWDGYIHLWRYGKFPTGLLPRAIKWLEQYEIPYEIVDERPEPSGVAMDAEHVNPEFVPFDFQHEAADAVIAHRHGILWLPTRTGKTIIGIEVYRRTRATPFLFVVRDRNLLHQAADAFRWALPGVRVGRVGDGFAETDADVVVCTTGTLFAAWGLREIKRKKKKKGAPASKARRPVIPAEVQVPREHHPRIRDLWIAAQAVAWDECHHCATDPIERLSSKLVNVDINIGLSATPWTEENRDLLLEAVIGPVIYRMTVEEAIAMGRLLPIHATVFKLPPRPILAARGEYAEIYRSAVVEDDWYHDLVASIAMRLRDEGHSVGVIVQHLAHGQRLSGRIPHSYWINGDTSREDRRAAFDAMSAGGGNILVSNVINEGVDMPGLSATVIADPKASQIFAIQRPARAATAFGTKKRAVAVYFEHDAEYLASHTYAAVSALRKEPLYKVVERRIHADGTISRARPLGSIKRGRRTCRILQVCGGSVAGERALAGNGPGPGAPDRDPGGGGPRAPGPPRFSDSSRFLPGIS